MATRQSKKETITTRVGYIAIIGRPNVGKSTLLNSFLGKKLSITSRKPQTTRHRILGVKTTGNTQMIFVDTPGMHLDEKKLMNQHLNKTALSTLNDADCVLWLLDATRWDTNDDWVAEKLSHCKTPVILVINKVDKLESSDDVIPLVEKMAEKLSNLVIIPISAKKKFNLDRLSQLIESHLPIGPFYFDKEQVTDRPESFVAAEFIREKLVRFLGDEMPYATMVSIESFKREGRLLRIEAVIWVEKESQKGIVIGKKGDMLKKIGEKSRLAMEKYFDQKIFLQTWVKVKEGWSENDQVLRETLM
ncbi:MAG TPA: GTPase Era [Gammaproteobacteria bacterium]|nr:GTPase Era [Gammaproteobacteria bacterium]